MTLDQLDAGAEGHIVDIAAERSFRRRLLELGLVPGTRIRLLRVAPLGDPIEFWARDSHWSMRRAEARTVQIELAPGARSEHARGGGAPRAAGTES